MSEAVEQAVARDDEDAAAEYAAVRGGGAGLIDFSVRGLIELSGTEVVTFLNGLVTNDVKALADGAWMAAAFPNVQGRLVAAVRILRDGDSFFIDTDVSTHLRVLQNLQRFTLAGDFRVRDCAEETTLISVQGAKAARCVAAVLGSAAAQVERSQVVRAEPQLLIIRATHTAEDGFDLFVPIAQAQRICEQLMGAGARRVGQEALEILRIEAGLPRYGTDVDETTVVLEAGLEEAVSYTKGCYLGQEIIARIHWRGHVARRLAGLIIEDGATVVARGARVRSTDGRELARVTSSVFSPQLGKTIALGLVKYDFLTPGTIVNVVEEGQEPRPAAVAALPFVRGSWYAKEA
ncbi:MAG: glycine cleavage T C-terminal barrel domain-containing protein [Pyrinomonadaceae bacterium]